MNIQAMLAATAVISWIFALFGVTDSTKGFFGIIAIASTIAWASTL